MSRVGPAAKIEVAKLPLFAAGPTCAALDIHSAERTIGGAGLMPGAFKATRTFPPRRLGTRNLLDDYQACNNAILIERPKQFSASCWRNPFPRSEEATVFALYGK